MTSIILRAKMNNLKPMFWKGYYSVKNSFLRYESDYFFLPPRENVSQYASFKKKAIFCSQAFASK